MKTTHRALTAVILVAVMLMPATFAVIDSDGAQPGGSVLLDMGNGSVTWYAATGSGTVGGVIGSTLNDNGHTYSESASVITIDGRTTTTIGAAQTTTSPFTVAGTTGVTVTSAWNVYKWNGAAWISASTGDAAESGAYYAVGFYPAGVVPAETPLFHAVTCNGTDSEHSNRQTAEISQSKESEIAWNYDVSTEATGGNFSVYSQILLAGGYALVKFGYSDNSCPNTAMMACIDLSTGDMKWSFRYDRTYYEVTTGAIVGNYVYVQASTGYIFKIDWVNSSGVLTASDVTTFDGVSFASYGGPVIPNDTGHAVHGKDYADGPTSLVYDSGALFCMASNGMVYCFDLDLRPVWSYQTDGKAYTYSPTVTNGFVITGMLDGRMYILNEADGSHVADQLVYSGQYMGDDIGSVTQIIPVRHGDTISLVMSFSDGLGMGAMKGGMAIYDFSISGHTLSTVMYNMNLGSTGTYPTHVYTEGKDWVYFMKSLSSVTSLCRVDLSGNIETLATGVYETHSALSLINGDTLVSSSYNKNYPVCMFTLSGEKTGECWLPESYRDFSMSNVILYDGGYLIGNDAGLISIKGGFASPKVLTPSEDMNLSMVYKLLIAAGVIAAICVIGYCIMRFGLGWEHPFAETKARFMRFLFGEEYTHNTLRRHRLWLVMGLGIVLTMVVCVLSLCLGPTKNFGLGEMFDALFSAIGKGGKNLTYQEMMVYSARLPRTIVALAVGIGLSIAGAMYQAVIRNPLVDPYIMGVSSGAGTAAIGVIAFDFTFFGLFSSHSIYLTAFAAAVGGLLAFLCTMFLAHRAGGTSISYVLSGVIVGLVFSAAQTLMMTFAGNHVTSALSWLYGSFSEITWTKVWIVLIPALGLSLASLFWAKEFNLVLLGEDQAKQMGLDVKRFNRWMLIIASVLTSICVAFVGIIGFVGLVIPHLCRMMLGGDHRLVLPASMAFGGFLMVVADLASRMIIPGFELPVGAITTIIGVPVFAWLLIKRGKMYDG